MTKEQIIELLEVEYSEYSELANSPAFDQQKHDIYWGAMKAIGDILEKIGVRESKE